MIALSTKITGARELNNRLGKIQNKINNPIVLHSRIAAYIFGAFQKNMVRGIDPEGKPLAPVAPWTRVVRGVAYKGKLIPLNATGGLRNAMNIWNLSSKGVMIGWKGKYLDVAYKMTKGIKGTIQVKQEPIKGFYSGIKTVTAKAQKRSLKTNLAGRKSGAKSTANIKANQKYNTGDQYVLIKSKDNKKWYSWKLNGGTLPVKPTARKFFYLTDKQVKKSMTIANRFIKEAINK
jgi:hypothetical protein